MVGSSLQRRSTRRRGRRIAFRLNLEVLENRTVPSVSWPGFLNPVAETEPNSTLDQAQNLGDLTKTVRAEVVGTISNAASGGGVDWYSFQLDRASVVSVSAPKPRASSPPVTTLSLYNSDPNDPNDPYDPLGYRLVAQVDSATQGGSAQITRWLAPGTYYVAVSGSGNDYFNPFLADSGYAGATGKYGLLVAAGDLGLTSSDGPVVLAADPQSGARLDRSPFLIRIDVSGPLDAATVSAGATVQLISNPTGAFGNGNDQAVNLASVTLDTSGNELLIAPAAPLAPGYYKVVLAGNTSTNAQVLADLNGIALGTTKSRPSGQDYSYTFQITGNEGSTTNGTTADDTPATAHQLGDITQSNLVQLAGAIGDDSTDPIPFDGSNVDLYHFQVSGSGRYALTAEVFAGRIGSPLSPGVSLFQADSTGQLSLVGSNAGTLNGSVATNGTEPLYADPVLNAGLTAGDYYLAVSNNWNVPDPVNSPPGTNGVFDPNISHSGQNGGSTGDYVLNLQVRPVQAPPRVVAVTPSEGATLNAPPNYLTVQFSEPVNLQQLAFLSPVNGISGALPAVYVEGSGGTKYYPALEPYDAHTDIATFTMLDGLSNGSYELHLSGPLGLADLAGDALLANDPSGDYVVHFNVNGPVRGSGNNPLLWSDQEPNNSVGNPQQLGTLFTNELETGVTLQRDFSQTPATAPADTADYYRFTVLEPGDYTLNFSSRSLPAGAKATLLDDSGTPVSVIPLPNSSGFFASLQSGTYVLHIGDWAPSQAVGVKYTAVIELVTTTGNPPALTVGPAPAISIQPVTNAPANPPSTPVVVNPPPSSPSSTTNNPPSTPPVVVSTPSAPPTNPVITTVVTPSTTTSAPTSSPAPPVDQPTAAPAAATAPSVPAPSSASVALLVNLLVPSGINNASIAPVAVRGGASRPTDSINLPSGVLLALGSAPVGGIKEATVTDTPSATDRVLVRVPDLSAARQLPVTTVSIPRVESGTSAIEPPLATLSPSAQPADADAADSVQVLPEISFSPVDVRANQPTVLVAQDIAPAVAVSYEAALDAFFSAFRWSDQTVSEALKSVVGSPKEIAAEEKTICSAGSGTTAAPVTSEARKVADPVFAISLAAISALAVAWPELRRNGTVPSRREELSLSSLTEGARL